MGETEKLLVRIGTARDAISRKEEQTSLDYMIDGVLMNCAVLLKEQDAFKPEKEHSGSGITWWNVCGNCKTAINPNDKYCHECGRAVMWDDV